MSDTKSKIEARKQERAERLSLWKELLGSKPDDTYEDPQDVASIRFAKLNMGDYKLKTDPKYVVPESERVDADKKKKQILLLVDSIFTLRQQFNKQVLELRDRKQKIVNVVKSYNGILQEINTQLEALEEAVDKDIWQPTMELSAYSDNRFVVTQQDVEELKKLEAEEAVRVKNGNDEMAANLSLSAAVPKKVDASNFGTNVKGAKVANLNATSKTSEKKPIPFVFTYKESLSNKYEKSPLEIMEQDIKRRELRYRKERIHDIVGHNVLNFDLSVDALTKERILLEGDLKFADIKLVLLYKEWALLKEFEKFDNMLAQKLFEKSKEKMEIDEKIKECQEKLGAQRREVEEVIAREKDLSDEFWKCLGENNKHEEYLTKVFKRKIKRSKVRLSLFFNFEVLF